MRPIPSILLGCLLLAACSDDSGGSDGSSGAGTTSNATGDICSPGLEGCPCVEGGLCIVGLACLSDICVDPAPLTTSASADEGGSEESGSSATTGAGMGPCTVSDDCEAWEVCGGGSCYDATSQYYNVTISWFAPPDCSDGWGSADVVFELFLDDEFVLRSSEQFCPADWSAEPFTYNGGQTLELSFVEADVTEDMPYTRLCWQDDYGNCAAVPASILHEGRFEGLTGDGLYAMKMTFDLL